MAKSLDWNSMYKMAKQNIKPTYRKLRKMDSDDWLASVGLERRNVGTDIAGAFGFILLGCAVGVTVGLLLAPKAGTELREDINKRIRGTSEQFGKEVNPPTYAS
jgi:hypothetical protein